MTSATLWRDVRVYAPALEAAMTSPTDVLIRGDRIAAIGDGLAGHAGETVRVVEGRGNLLMPGLVNGHFHSPVNHMKGALDGLPLEIFMLYESPASEVLRPTPREAYLRTMLAALEMLRCGTTAVYGGGVGDIFIGGAGNATAYGGTGDGLFLATGAGAMAITEGAGNDEVVLGAGATTVTSGSGVDRYDVNAGQAGGAYVIAGFKLGVDHVRRFGYDLTTLQQSAGNSGLTLTLSDSTRITLLGVSKLAANSVL